MALDFPSKIINSPDFAPVLGKVFSYYADVYDLEAYEAIQPGFGKSVWELVEAAQGLEDAQQKFDQSTRLTRMLG